MPAPQTAQRPGPRIHRLPRRLDYPLVPPPLDLSLDTMTEKSPLPAIIVTPSSPTHPKDFGIAFLAPPKPPTLRSRIARYCSEASTTLSPTKWRFWSSNAPIALPLSAPATTTEFSIPTYPSNAAAKRNSCILMVVLTIFCLMFLHMIAHFFAYASMSRGAMTSAAFQDTNNVDLSAGAGYWDKIVGWVSKATPNAERALAGAAQEAARRR